MLMRGVKYDRVFREGDYFHTLAALGSGKGRKQRSCKKEKYQGFHLKQLNSDLNTRKKVKESKNSLPFEWKKSCC